jgi:hypothetical protein
MLVGDPALRAHGSMAVEQVLLIRRLLGIEIGIHAAAVPVGEFRLAFRAAHVHSLGGEVMLGSFYVTPSPHAVVGSMGCALA